MTGVRVVSESLGGSPLSQAVAAGRLDARIAASAPRDGQAWSVRMREVAKTMGPAWLDRLRGAFGGPVSRLERLERTANAGGVVVTTGQQAGLFGGPIYTWSKAIGALALADALERETGIAAAPVFWAATDDADFAEANHTYVLKGGAAERLELPRAPAAGTPMAAVTLDGVAPLRDALRSACGSMAYAEAWRAAEAAYADGATVGGAYVRLLRALLEPLGIAVLDSSHPAVRGAGAAVLRRALERAADVEAALGARHAWIVGQGYAPQVSDVAGLSTVFVSEDGRKRRVRVAEAAAVAASAPAAALGPNVLLRPVLERAVLPTVAYVAGPGELAYFAQVSAVAEALGADQPLAVPRWSCTIVEPAVDRALERLGVGLDDVREAAALEGRIARAEVPAAVHAALSALRASMTDGLAALRAADGAAGAEPLLRPEVIEGAGRQIGFRFDRLERRLVAAAKRRGSEALRDLRLARSALWPGEQRQERTLNFLPLLARYGPSLWQHMGTAAGEHAARVVGGGGA